MKIQVVTLFPSFFDSPLTVGLSGKAVADGVADVGFVDPRSFAEDKHRSVDDTPYGGGAGMVMMPELVVPAIEEARAKAPGARVLMLSPQGRPLRHADCERWAEAPGLVLVAGRYEGFDERIRDYVDEEVSLGDFVSTGGEYGALAIIDAVVRLLPGTVGNAESTFKDSFAEGLLEHPQYTRPAEFRGSVVPEVLMSGHHENIETWRHAESLQRTRTRRPDLLEELALSPEARVMLKRTESALPPFEIVGVLSHPRVMRKYLRLAVSYGAQAAHIVFSDAEQTRAVIDGLRRDLVRPRPLGKKSTRKQRARFAAETMVYESWTWLLDNTWLHATPETARAHLETRQGGWLVASERNATAGDRIGPRALLEATRSEGRRLVFWFGGEIEARWALHDVRRVSPAAEISGIVDAAIQLDRVLGEG